MKMERYICIHGHFYQPPRENAWLETIELQDSADPYHDWNERINAECYAPNALSRILDGEDRIVRIVNNYSRISFNFGPTLLSWMEKKAPEVHEAIVQADRESAQVFSGHGSAMAQPYNHMILPLANRRDKVTQVAWGLRDFQRRFGRASEGMWLPETAADTESLEVLAEHGIRFTVLAPSQARAIRKKGEEAWQEVNGGGIDPSRAYEVPLPSGRTIAVFFYDGPISRAVAFEQLLSRGEHLANRLAGAFNDARDWPQIVHIATDGETYGHHHRHGEMALAYALHHIESNGLARLTNYGEYLEKHPPDHQALIHDNSSWSCVHGVERWKSDCGCNTGGHPGWNQAWRAPLRGALDWLRDELVPLYEKEASHLLEDPWKARDDYADIVLDRSPENRERFLARHVRRGGSLDDGQKLALWKLLELQRHALLMYTSCGWFFDELSGIETVQVIQYAARALQLAGELTGASLEEPFLERLDRARSNLPENEGGRRIYDTFVRPAMVDHFKVGGHYAISSIFRKYGNRDQVYCFLVDRRDFQLHQAGEARLAVGRVDVMSRITGEAQAMSFGVLHWGDHNLNGGVRRWTDEKAYQAMQREVGEAFTQADFSEVIRRFERHFGTSTDSLRSLFKDEQRAILDQILKASHDEAQAAYRQIYERRAPMMRFLTSLSIPLPRAFRAAAEFVVNAYLREAFERPELDLPRIAALLEQARLEGVALNRESLSFVVSRSIERLLLRCAENPTSAALLRTAETAVAIGRSMPLELDLWKAQNIYYSRLRQETFPAMHTKAEVGDPAAGEWREALLALGDRLGFRRPEPT
jgi:alpha-amylase/alpha-mannosidase (GH57 family)